MRWTSRTRGVWGKSLRGLQAALAIAVAWCLCAVWLDTWGRREDTGETYDAIVVLGCQVWPDGEASPALERRARHAVRLWKQGRAPIIVFTGGVGEHAPSEARAASVVAARLGVPPEAMRLEEASTSTFENARYAEEQVGSASRVLVVTDSYHVFRSEHVFARRFARADAVGSVGSRSVRVRGALREVFAVAAYAVLGRLG